MRGLFKCLFFAATLLNTSPTSAGSIISENPQDLQALQDLLKTMPTAGGFVFLGDMVFRAGDVGTLGALVPNRWEQGRFVYTFEPGTDATKMAAFDQACAAWTVNTPITCVRRTTERDYVMVVTHSGGNPAICNGFNTSCSFHGKVGNMQQLWVYTGHWNDQSTLIHEIGHALGLIHEHMRSDRDSYVYIRSDNMQSGSEGQFSIFPSAQPLSSYDYLSIMHYPNCAYSNKPGCTQMTPDLQTIIPRACHLDIVGGNSITELDRESMRRAYAPALQALLVESHRAQCGQYEFTPDQVTAACGPNCTAATPTSFKKIDTIQRSFCGWHPIQYPHTWCIPINKTFIRYWTDKDDASCPWFQDRHEYWAECGCPVQTFAAKCTATNELKQEVLEKTTSEFPIWRDGRLKYFNEIMLGLKSDGLLGNSVADRLGELYQKNYLDPRFETKFMKTRAGVFSYARWKRSVDANYVLEWDDFKKIAGYRRLTLP